MGGAVPPLPNTPSWRGAQLGEHFAFTTLVFSLRSILNCSLTSYFSGPNIFPSICSQIRAIYNAHRPYSATRKIILYILTFSLLQSTPDNTSLETLFHNLSLSQFNHVLHYIG
jgi:hypothetical protein